MILLLSLSCDVRGLSSLERRLRSGMVGRAVGVVIMIVRADETNGKERQGTTDPTSFNDGLAVDTYRHIYSPSRSLTTRSSTGVAVKRSGLYLEALISEHWHLSL